MPGFQPSEFLDLMFKRVIQPMFPPEVQEKWKSLMTQANNMEAQALLEQMGMALPEQQQPVVPPPVQMTDEERALENASTLGGSRKYLDKRKKKDKKKKDAQKLLGLYPWED